VNYFHYRNVRRNDRRTQIGYAGLAWPESVVLAEGINSYGDSYGRRQQQSCTAPFQRRYDYNVSRLAGRLWSLDIDEFDVHAPVQARDVGVVTFVADTPGTYTFYCAPHYDPESGEGMQGTLIVE
jgi:hypothetical protein